MTNRLSRIIHWLLVAAGLVWLAGGARAQTPVSNGMSAQITAAWTSATTAGASGAQVLVPMAGFSTAAVNFSASGSLSGGAVTFEATTDPNGNINFQSVTCFRTGATPSADVTYTLTGANQNWQCPAAGMQYFRIRLSTTITGTGTANITGQATAGVGAAAFAYMPVDQPNLNTPLNVSSLPAQSAVTTTAWTSATAVNTALSAATAGYNAALVALNQTSTLTNGGTVSFEASDTNPGTNWFSVNCMAPTTNGPIYTFQASVNVAFQCNVIGYQAFRARLSNAIGGSGTVNVSLQFSSSGSNIPPPLPVTPSTGVVNANTISSTYLGSGSANTAKTTGAITLSTPATSAMTAIYVVGCSGNYATTLWTSAVLDSAGNSYVPIGTPATSTVAFPQANSTTQVCVQWLAKNSSAVTTITFTISNTNSANTTVAFMAWGITSSTGQLTAVDGWAPGASSGATALSTQVLVPSEENELVIAAGCASTGTISLPSTSGLNFDTGSIAIASGSNCATLFGGSAVLHQPQGVTGSFTDGSSAAYSEVVIAFRGFSQTNDGLQHLTGNMINGGPSGAQARNNYSGFHPALVAPPPAWASTVNAASGVTASFTVTGAVGKLLVLTQVCAGINGDSTGAAAQQVFTVTDSSSGSNIVNSNFNNPTGVGAIGRNQCFGPLNVPITAGANIVAAFAGNTAHALEELSVSGYTIDLSGVVY